MIVLWILVCLAFPHHALFSGLDHCEVHESNSKNMSPLLQSLQCHNDYMSFVYCKWKAPKGTTLQVWLKKVGSRDSSSKLCVPSEAENKDEEGVVHCRYKTHSFVQGINHAVFLINNQTTSLCSSSQHTSQDLVQHLRARPPRNLYVSEESDGNQTLLWSSTYPSSSSLNRNLTYELSFRMQAEDQWTTETVANTSITLQRQRLLPGRKYEARVRSKASLGLWSEWSPVVMWKTRDDFRQVPSLHCILDAEDKVTCSWEVSRELAHIVTYQLTCRHNLTTQFKQCCTDPVVRSDPALTEVNYSCSLTEVDLEHLHLRLLPMHNTKTFIAYKHIRPNLATLVQVKEENGDWVVSWSPPALPAAIPDLLYQVRYYRTKDQGSFVQLNVSGSTFVTIPGTSLIPLEDYEVKVRSLVDPGSGQTYEGIPSEWSDPANWTSNKASWTVSYLIYFFSGVIAAAAFLTLYHTIPACQKKVMSWEDSVPSPGKSKVLSEITSSPSPSLMQSEKTSICSVQHLDSISTCSSEALLWPTMGTEKKCMDKSGRCWNCDYLSNPTDKVKSLDGSSMSFSGPYILCQDVGSTSVNAHPAKVNETSSNKAAPFFPAPCLLNDKDYVSLPGHSLSRSTGDLTSHSNSGSKICSTPEQDQQRPNATLQPAQCENQSALLEPSVMNLPSDYTSGPFPSWPQEGTNSGYCQLPSVIAQSK
ncbi:cytokine receptor common subunit beta isoform X1 [Cyprinodon tularosa]|uniref:cytokine receptor common subunit beta isoform X1 n=1 Tax=Cyprinodon tularosa TaxID=77115 RepID=UPI0018E227D2|nr:cytokine receptor common subunit beta isoform X1 [Cyprinodon tularosa]XP_038123635.1 cytokine receptor common subunit beta isoform X1 [Cyprinodon tularosa]